MIGRFGAVGLTDTGHLHTLGGIVLEEEWMIVGASLGSSSDSRKVPSIELASEAGEL